MPLLLRRSSFLPVAILVSVFTFLYFIAPFQPPPPSPVIRTKHDRTKPELPPGFRWQNVREHYPVDNFTSLPTGPSIAIPKVQYDFPPETAAQKEQRQIRLSAVKEAFIHSWEGYKRHAWLQDEVAPISGRAKNTFGGWGATLVDTLDTLWIMGLKKEFFEAVHSLKTIDFTRTDLEDVNVFETTIRYLGGLLSAYDLSDQAYPELLNKATELGEMLYLAFDTPNRLPVTRWDWKNTALGGTQTANPHSLLAELGSLSLEFTRLSQLTHNPKYYDAIARITTMLETQQNSTKLPGLWPVTLDAKTPDFTKARTFSFGGMADSTYEYLPKQHVLLAAQNPQYKAMYTTAIETAKRELFFRPLNPQNRSLLLSGTAWRNSAMNVRLQPEGQHLACFAGGMVALASKVFERHQDLEVARQLADGCVWAYESLETDIMPEVFRAAPCWVTDDEDCSWSEEKWFAAVAAQERAGSGIPGGGHSRLHQVAMAPEEVRSLIEAKGLPPGFTEISDPRYLLRPEAVESLFVLYRITGERYWQDKAWEMFLAVTAYTKTEIGYAGIEDVRVGDGEGEEVRLLDSMESFWTAETLKYFWLVFERPEVVSLDQWVLNTEAHPLRRPG